MPVKNKLTFVYALSGLLAVLLTVSSVTGLLYGGRGLYDPYPASVAGMVGQDLVALAVIVPLLVASMSLTARGSIRGLLLWAGSLLWAVYSYYFYVVGGFNALFLLYIAIVSTSLYSLLSLLFALDPEEVRARFGVGTPVRLVGGFFVGYSLLFAIMWVGMSLAGVAAGTEPDEVTHSVVVIDLSVLLPLLLFGGLRLWHRMPWGYVLGGLLLVKMATSGFTLAFTTALGWAWSGAINLLNIFLLVLFTVMTAGALALLVPYLRNIKERGSKEPALAGVARSPARSRHPADRRAGRGKSMSTPPGKVLPPVLVCPPSRNET